MPQTPILIITGFLGSGKTTFINWLLETNPNKKISLILNEFGDVKLESQLITQKNGVEIAELANGCMCCVAKSDIPRVIDHIIQNAPQTEQIVIEASGLSDPDPILASLRGPELADKVKLDAVVCVIDCLNFLQTSKEHSIVMSQIGDADIVVLNKINQTDPQVVQTIEQTVKRIGINTTVLRWDEQLSSEFFFDPRIETHHHDDEQHSHEHHHDHYDEVWFSSDKNIDITKLSEIIRALPSNIIRSKGFANWNGQKVMVQFVAGRADFLESDWEQNTPSTNILFLGTDIAKDELLAQLQACEVQTTTP